MRCNNVNCLTIITLLDEVHVTGDSSPRYYHAICVGDEKIDHVIPVKVKEFRNEPHRRASDQEYVQEVLPVDTEMSSTEDFRGRMV